MNPIIAQWLPVITIIFAIWFGLLYNNKRLDDFKDMLRMQDEKHRAEIASSGDKLRSEILRSHSELEAQIHRNHLELQAEIHRSFGASG